MKLSGNESTVYILKELGSRVRDARIAIPMTRETLSEKSGVSLSTIARLEGGRNISMEAMINILRALNQLHTIDLLIPEYQLTPMELAEGKPRKKRARSKASEKGTTWTWGGDRH